MITKITGEQPFQVLTNNFSISPSSEGYTLQISADGTNFSNLFTVGAGVTRLVTGVAANSYYRLSGNQSKVSINWMKTCVTEGGAAGNELTPVTEFPLNADPGTVVALASGDTYGIYQYDGTNWNEAGADVDLSAYWTSAQTQSAITAVEDHLFDFEEVTSSALTELHEGLLEVSGRTVDLSGYYTSAQTDSAIENVLEDYWTSADTKNYVDDELTGYTPTSGFSTINGSAITNGGNIVIQGGGGGSTEEIELPIAAAVNGLKENIEARLNQKYYTKQDVNDIAAGKTDPGQVNVQIENYVEPAIAEVNDNIENKELATSAAINDLNTATVKSTAVKNIWSGTQNEYDAIVVKDPATLYIIKD